MNVPAMGGKTIDVGRHCVQFFGTDEHSLVRNVARYLGESLERGGGAIVIAESDRSRRLEQRLNGTGADRAIFLDARETLAAISDGGTPDRERFDAVVGEAIRSLRERISGAEVRAYGEMVAILWREGRLGAASRLEGLWNDLLARHDFRLYCSYPIDVFDSEFRIGAIDAVMCAHTDVVPSPRVSALQHALDVAMDEMFGGKAHGLRLLMKPNYRPAWGSLPSPEAAILWIRNNLPVYADEILTRARRHYEASA